MPSEHQVMLEIGPIRVNHPYQDDQGRVLIPVTGTPASLSSGNYLFKHLTADLKQLEPNAVVETIYSENQQGGRDLTIRVSNAAPINVHAALGGVQTKYFSDLSATRFGA